MKKNFVSLVLVAVLVLASGCGAPAPETTEKPIIQEATSTPEPAVVQEETVVEETEEPIEEGEPELIWSVAHEESLHSVASSGETVAVGEYKVTYIHHLADGSLVNVLAHEHTVDDLAFSKDEAVLGAGQGYYGVQLSNIVDHMEPRTIGGGHDSKLAFSPDGQYLATGNREGTVWVWQLEGLAQAAVLENPEVPGKAVMDRRILGIEYYPSGGLLAVTHADNNVYIWDMANKDIIQTLSYGADVTATSVFRFSPNGFDMAVAVKDGGNHLIRLCSVDGGETLRDLSVPERVKDLAYSPDGSMLAIASRQATTIWNVASGELCYMLNQSITPPTDSPVALTFTPDGGHVAVARWDGTIELWRLPGAEPIALPPVVISEPPPFPGDVLFDTGSAKLKQEAYPELTAFAEELHENFNEATIKFVGHTDSRGDAGSNLQLSIDRAAAIQTWFQNWADDNGADGWNLLVDGKGESELKVPDVDVEGKFLNDAGALNRRVEIEIEPGK